MFRGEKLKAIRKSGRLSQEKFAKKLGITRATLSYWENNKHQPPPSEIDRIIKVLKIKRSDITNLDTADNIDTNVLNRLKKSQIQDYKNDLSVMVEKITRDIDKAYTLFNAVINSRSSKDYFYIKNSENRYIKASKTFLKLFNKAPDFDVTNLTDNNFFSHHIALRNSKEDLELMANRKSKIEIEEFLENKKIYRVRKNPIFSQDGKNEVAGLLCDFIDISNEFEEDKHHDILAKTLDQTNLGIHILGKSNKKYCNLVYISESVKEVFGYSQEDFKDPNIDFIESIMVEKFKKEYKKARKAQTQCQYQIVDNEGNKRWIETNFLKVRYRAKDCLLMVHKDKSETIRQEMRLQLFIDLMEHNFFTGIICKQMLENGKNKLIGYNKQVLEILELSEKEFNYNSHKEKIYNLMHPDDRKPVTDELENAKEKSTPITKEFRIITKNHTKWIREQISFLEIGERKFYSLFLQDITTEKETFKIFDNMQIGIAVYDIEYDKYIYANKLACEIYGYTYEDYKRKNISQLTGVFHKDDEEIRGKIIKHYFPEGKTEWDVDYRIIVSGNIKYLRTKRKKSTFGNRDCVIINIIDITESITEKSKKDLLLAALECSKVGFWVLPYNNKDTDEYLYKSSALAEVLSYPLEQFKTPLDFKKIVLQEDWKEIYIKDNQLIPMTFRIKASDGKIRWIKTIPSYFNYLDQKLLLLISTDVTKEKESAIELAATKLILELKNTVLDNLGDSAFFIKNLTSGEVIEVDEQFTKITGFTKEDAQNGLIGNFNRILPEDSVQLKPLWEEYIKTEDVNEVTYRMKRKDEKVITVIERFSKKTLNNEVYYIQTIKDISEEIEKEKYLDKAIKSDLYYNLFKDNKEIGCYIVDGKVFEEYNIGMQNITGYTHEEINQIGWRNIIPKNELEKAVIVFENSIQYNTPFEEVYNIKCKDGSIKKIKDVAKFQYLKNRKLFFGVITVVT